MSIVCTRNREEKNEERKKGIENEEGSGFTEHQEDTAQ